MRLTVRAPAKVNLHLGVARPRPDGFHPLVTVFHALDLVDEVTVSPGPGRVTATGRDGGGVSGVPLDDTNIAARALAAVGAWPADVHLDKAIPVAGGMAGGSADAAAALVAGAAGAAVVCPTTRSGATSDTRGASGLADAALDLATLAATLGSDVPFALLGGTAIGRGRGELLEPVAHPGRLHWVVVPAAGGLPTPAVYRRFDELHPDAPETPDEPTALLAALATGDPAALAPTLHNDLQAPALDLRPELAETLAAGEAAGALRGIVSGSGPTCVFLCLDADHAGAVADALRAAYAPLCATGPAPGASHG